MKKALLIFLISIFYGIVSMLYRDITGLTFEGNPFAFMGFVLLTMVTGMVIIIALKKK